MDKEALKTTFERRGYTVTFCENGAAARTYLSEKLKRTSVAFGGSETLAQIGLYDELARNNAVVWHRNMMSNDVKQLASHAKVYITSANAVAETGEIVNIDGTGNRLAMSMYGPEKVYFVIGSNKLTPDLASAQYRAKNVAAPKNARRLGAKTPCAAMGDRCYDCKGPGRICRLTLIMDAAPSATDCEIIFVDEELGF